MYSEDETKRSILESVDYEEETVDQVQGLVLVADERLKRQESPTSVQLCDQGRVPDDPLRKRSLRF